MPPDHPRSAVQGRRRAMAAGVVLLAASALAGAAEWIVDDDGPADFRSVQAAIDAVYVLSGDIILVRPGRYTGNVYLDTKDLVIRSDAGPFRTTLDAEGSGSVVSLYGRSPMTRIEGFTLTGGRDQTGGGVWIYGGAPVITRNVITANSAVGGFLGYGYGGGIEIYGAAPTITRNVIQGNTALDGGGGIDVYYAGPSTAGTCCPLIAQNTIVGNLVSSPSGTGGGILSFASQPVITASILEGNRAAAGGGVHVYAVQGNRDEPQAETNLFFSNTPDDADSGGGWRLPASNRHADPRLGSGEGSDLWPRSDSPALDRAAPGLPAGPDLFGSPGPRDGDLDGTASGDIGALEGLGEITALTVGHDPAVAGGARLAWDASVNAAVRYNLYASDGDPFRLGGGACLSALLASPGWTDATTPPPGKVRYYLVTGVGAVEGSRGLRSDGTQRPSFPSCLGP